MDQPVILSAVRTPIGKFQGGLSGFPATELGAKAVAEAVRRASELEGIVVVGLMTIPPVMGGGEAARPYFGELRRLRDEVRSSHPDLPELSMGMSDDYEVAIEEGATMVRVGTALFGARPIPPVAG